MKAMLSHRCLMDSAETSKPSLANFDSHRSPAEPSRYTRIHSVSYSSSSCFPLSEPIAAPPPQYFLLKNRVELSSPAPHFRTLCHGLYGLIVFRNRSTGPTVVKAVKGSPGSLFGRPAADGR